MKILPDRDQIQNKNLDKPCKMAFQYSALVLLVVVLAIVGTVLTLNGNVEVLKH